MTDLDKLCAEMRAGLEGVTPGPWLAAEDSIYRASFVSGAGGESWVAAMCGGGPTRAIGKPEERKNAAHIARCSPENIRAILDERDRLREALEPFAAIAKSRDRATLEFLNNQGPGPHNVADYQPDDVLILTDGSMRNPLVATLGDLRRARDLLKGGSDD